MYINDLKLSRHSWPEHFDHENGQYLCSCLKCHEKFIGHKRSLCCKVCYIQALQRQVKGFSEIIEDLQTESDWRDQEISNLQDVVEKLETALLDIKNGKDNPCHIVEQALTRKQRIKL